MVYFLLFSGSTSPPVKMGCFKDANDRDLGPGWSNNKMTQEMCFQRCGDQKAVYAGLQTGDWCHCGNSYGKHGSVPNGECNAQCKGNWAQKCGGPWRNDVYYIG